MVTAVSIPKIKSRIKAYLCAREKLEHILTPLMTVEEIRNHGVLSINEVKKIMALPDSTQEEARNILVALLGITCGLGVSEIRNLERKHVTLGDMLLIDTPHGTRSVPLIGNVKKRIEKMNQHFPESRYVIPNFKDHGKPCNPISINRALFTVNESIGISNERNIVPSVLWETFIMLLITCHKDIENKTLDYLCDFGISEDDFYETVKRDVIRAINLMMITLEDMEYSAFSVMKWNFT
jgi:integrase